MNYLEAKAAEQRSANLFRYFGWTGGTIHQISAVTGVSVDDLLYTVGDYHTDAFQRGRLANSCGSQNLRDQLIPHVRGNREFWIGVAEEDSRA